MLLRMVMFGVGDCRDTRARYVPTPYNTLYTIRGFHSTVQFRCGKKYCMTNVLASRELFLTSNISG